MRVKSSALSHQPKWLVISSHNDSFHLWKETHKDIAHQLHELDKVASRVEGLERTVELLRVKNGELEGRVELLERNGSSTAALVSRCIRSLLEHSAQLNLIKQLFTAFLLYGRPGGDGPPGSPGGPGSGGSSPSCPSLISLESSWLDSPIIDTPAADSGSRPRSVEIIDEADWLRATMSSVEGSASEDGSNSGLPGTGGVLGGVGSVSPTGGGVADASDRGGTRCAGLSELVSRWPTASCRSVSADRWNHV